VVVGGGGAVVVGCVGWVVGGATVVACRVVVWSVVLSVDGPVVGAVLVTVVVVCRVDRIGWVVAVNVPGAGEDAGRVTS